MELLENIYKGDGKRRKTKRFDNAIQEKEPYFTPGPLIEAVKTALHLRRPLLLEGDPGCGKTRLAYSVAYELGCPMLECYVNSTTKATDLLYKYDAVKRLYDLQFKASNPKIDKTNLEIPAQETFITLGKLGEAIKLSSRDIPSVVLIDEIDKADIDFPNDLLLVLDRYQFTVEEIDKPKKVDALKGQSIEQRRPYLPLVIITSNREKPLPMPFLRRCLYYNISFPGQETMEKIVKEHTKEFTPLFREAVKKFWELRNNSINWLKPPGTSELLDWLKILEINEMDPQRLANSPDNNLPHAEALVKTRKDTEALKSAR